VENLGGVDVRVRWNPAIARVVDAMPGRPGTQIARGDLFAGDGVIEPEGGNSADNAAGELTYALLRVGGPPGVTGAWSVAVITFEATISGTTAVEFFGPDTLMTDPMGVDIPSGRMNGQIQVMAQPGDTTPTPTPTPSVTPEPSPTVIACADAIENGDFEAGGTSWEVQHSTIFDVDIAPHSGTKAAYLGGYDNAQDGLYQQVVIPADTVTATLSYWWYLFTVEPDHPHDYLYVEVYDTSGVLIAEVARFDDGATPDTWQQATADLSAYAGQTIRISFRIETDGQHRSSFYVDDVVLDICRRQSAPEGDLFLPLIYRHFQK
jgi:hypothetical protein